MTLTLTLNLTLTINSRKQLGLIKTEKENPSNQRRESQTYLVKKKIPHPFYLFLKAQLFRIFRIKKPL